MPAEGLECFIDGEQVSLNDGRIDGAGSHRPKSPRAIRAACAASIFRSRAWGT